MMKDAMDPFEDEDGPYRSRRKSLVLELFSKEDLTSDSFTDNKNLEYNNNSSTEDHVIARESRSQKNSNSTASDIACDTEIRYLCTTNVEHDSIPPGTSHFVDLEATDLKSAGEEDSGAPSTARHEIVTIPLDVPALVENITLPSTSNEFRTTQKVIPESDCPVATTPHETDITPQKASSSVLPSTLDKAQTSASSLQCRRPFERGDAEASSSSNSVNLDEPVKDIPHSTINVSEETEFDQATCFGEAVINGKSLDVIGIKSLDYSNKSEEENIQLANNDIQLTSENLHVCKPAKKKKRRRSDAGIDTANIILETSPETSEDQCVISRKSKRSRRRSFDLLSAHIVTDDVSEVNKAELHAVQCEDPPQSSKETATVVTKPKREKKPRSSDVKTTRSKTKTENVDDIYHNRLWRSQMPKQRSFESIPEEMSGKAKQMKPKHVRCRVDFDTFHGKVRTKKRRQRAIKMGWKPLTNKQKEALDILVCEKLEQLETDMKKTDFYQDLATVHSQTPPKVVWVKGQDDPDSESSSVSLSPAF